MLISATFMAQTDKLLAHHPKQSYSGPSWYSNLCRFLLHTRFLQEEKNYMCKGSWQVGLSFVFTISKSDVILKVTKMFIMYQGHRKAL